MKVMIPSIINVYIMMRIIVLLQHSIWKLNIVLSVDKIIHIYHNSENVLLIIEMISIYKYFLILLNIMYIIVKVFIKSIVRYKIFLLVNVSNVKQIILIFKDSVNFKIKFKTV